VTDNTKVDRDGSPNQAVTFLISLFVHFDTGDKVFLAGASILLIEIIGRSPFLETKVTLAQR
jgi:hypothetical protein